MRQATYILTTYMDVKGEAPDRSGIAVLVDPRPCSTDREVVLDAREARLLQTKAPQRPRTGSARWTSSIIDKFGVEMRSAYAVFPTIDDVYVSPTERVTRARSC